MARGARVRGVERRAFGTHEIAHTHNGQVDVRLTRAGVRDLRDELRSDARIDLRGPGFDWILIRVRNAADVKRAVELLRYAMRAAGGTVTASRGSAARRRARTRQR